jgi:TonB family protein
LIFEYDCLDENAVESVKSWRFEPAMRNGQPVVVAMKIEVEFRLH